jgi:hypothetical protein
MAVAYWPRRPAQARGSVRSQIWRARPCSPLLGGVAENVALAGFGRFPDMERAGSPSLRRQAQRRGRLEAFSLVKTRRFAMRELSLLGEAHGIAVGAGRF